MIKTRTHYCRADKTWLLKKGVRKSRFSSQNPKYNRTNKYKFHANYYQLMNCPISWQDIVAAEPYLHPI